ncbi:MAG TPA: S9 family peptidase [Acidimicrobiales bacterium]|nr:S9 family peptidase [Acidimicrobiales bacterium]
MPAVAPYGSWTSPLTVDLLVDQAVGLSQLLVDGGCVYWNESRPSEGGRQVVVRLAPGAPPVDVVPPGFSARTRVHEYGGQAFAVHGGTVWFSNLSDQRVYRVGGAGGAGGDGGDGGEAEPEAVTAEPASPGALRYADPVVSPDGEWLVCIRERHPDGGGEPVNDVVVLPTAGGAEPAVLVEGHDFFAAPRLSPDGTRLCWLAWDHPDMPWDGTELWVAPFAGGRLAGPARLVAGGRGESVSQPRWSPGGVLHFVSDRSGWWNLYAEGAGCLAAMEADFGGPDWVFGQATYAIPADGTVVAAWADSGVGRLGVVEGGRVVPVEVPYTGIAAVRAAGEGTVVAIAGSPTEATAVVRITVASGAVEVLKRSRPAVPDPGYLSAPEPVAFPTEGGRSAHALFYRPRNRDFAAPEGERPPLVVMSHGGPTAAASATLNLGLQYWTSRGFAVVDVDYGGSTGYGRAYRERLRGEWGVVDVDDCVNAALHLAGAGLVDPDRMVIRGSSAGGFTTLAALAFHGVFAAGASLYGVADLEALARDTHKFEARYLDGLVGPYPEARDRYRQRSPIHHTDRLDRPMILFQGLDDPVVPPAQAEAMVAALRAKGVPHAYLAFEGESHGFRRAETIKRVAEAELSFYGQVLGFESAGVEHPVVVENL